MTFVPAPGPLSLTRIPALVLLRGKELSLPIEVEAIFIGLCLGLVFGLFYYHYYRRPYYWWYSLGTGAVSSLLSLKVLQRIPGFDPGELSNLLLEFVIPFMTTLMVNHYLYILKKRSRKKHRRKRVEGDRKMSALSGFDDQEGKRDVSA